MTNGWGLTVRDRIVPKQPNTDYEYANQYIEPLDHVEVEPREMSDTLPMHPSLRGETQPVMIQSKGSSNSRDRKSMTILRSLLFSSQVMLDAPLNHS